MLLEKLSGFDVALWDRSILNSESNINIIESGTQFKSNN
jgi:hypothetical protein